MTGRRLPPRRGSDEADRAARYGHAGKAIVFAAESGEAAHDVAARVERSVFARGVHSYCLSATDLGDAKDVLGREAHLGRVGEIAWAMTDAGIVLVAALGRRRPLRPRPAATPGRAARGVSWSASTPADEIGADLELRRPRPPTRRRRRRFAPSPPPASCPAPA